MMIRALVVIVLIWSQMGMAQWGPQYGSSKKFQNSLNSLLFESKAAENHEYVLVVRLNEHFDVLVEGPKEHVCRLSPGQEIQVFKGINWGAASTTVKVYGNPTHGGTCFKDDEFEIAMADLVEMYTDSPTTRIYPTQLSH
jgi:hypothetical protein